jgi:hypothetical protein
LWHIVIGLDPPGPPRLAATLMDAEEKEDVAKLGAPKTEPQSDRDELVKEVANTLMASTKEVVETALEAQALSFGKILETTLQRQTDEHKSQLAAVESRLAAMEARLASLCGQASYSKAWKPKSETCNMALADLSSDTAVDFQPESGSTSFEEPEPCSRMDVDEEETVIPNPKPVPQLPDSKQDETLLQD